MKRTKIEGSSNIDEIGYDYELRTMEIKFHNGQIYQYWPVNQTRWDLFLNSTSKGSYFIKHIRHNPKIHYRKLDDEMQAAK